MARRRKGKAEDLESVTSDTQEAPAAPRAPTEPAPAIVLPAAPEAPAEAKAPPAAPKAAGPSRLPSAVVAAGKALTTRRGLRKAGQVVRSTDLELGAGGEELIAKLVAKGVLVAP